MKFKGKDISAVYCREKAIGEVRCRGKLIWPDNTDYIQCDENFEYEGNDGTVELEINFGTAIGTAGITHFTGDRPDKFTIIWNGVEVTTGFIGSSLFDQELLDAGVPISDINTADPQNGDGDLLFEKTSALPTTAIVRVEAPLDGTRWTIAGICPLPSSTTYIVEIITPPEGQIFTEGDTIILTSQITES